MNAAINSATGSESTPTRGRTFQDAKREVLARFEREYFTALYAECSGNVSEIGRRAAMERVRDDFLAVRSLLQYLALFEKLLAVTPPAA